MTMKRYVGKVTENLGATYTSIKVVAKDYTDAYKQVLYKCESGMLIAKIISFNRRRMYGRKKDYCRA